MTPTTDDRDGTGRTRLPARLLRGAAAGVIATLVMSLPMLVARRLGLLDRQPPEEITRNIAAEGRPGMDGDTGPAAALAHLGFGAVAGALFAVGTEGIERRRDASLAGVAYGVLIWAVSYRGVLPRAGLIRSADHVGPGRDAVMLLAHLVYGAALGALTAFRGDRRGRGQAARSA